MTIPLQEGARRLVRSLELRPEEGLLVLTAPACQSFAEELLDAARREGFREVLCVLQPEALRPMQRIPDLLRELLVSAGGLIHAVDRRAEENFTFNRPLQALCESEQCRYVYVYDAERRYLAEGIAADYQVVDDKTRRIAEVLRDSRSLRVTSAQGTDLRFRLYTENIIPRSPLFPPDRYWNQAPEGEVMCCPVEETYEGVLVVDGPVTGLGPPPSPITWRFEQGRVCDVEGESAFLESLWGALQRSDPRLESLIGMWIAEFSVGANDWARFDENISNSEKVSGGVHFAMGNSEGLGRDRGERYHFDNIVKSPTVRILGKAGSQVTLIDEGRLQI